MGSYFSYEKNIVIQNNKFIKIPYIHNKKTYYMLLPIDESIKNKVISLINNEEVKEIYMNNIIECMLKLKDNKKEIDITTYIESYIGPDQFYTIHKNNIYIKDILPLKFHEQFEYLKIMDIEMETKIYTNLNEPFL